MSIPTEAGKFAFSWAKLTPENKTLVVLLCGLGLMGFILYSDRDVVVTVLKEQNADLKKEILVKDKAAKSKDSTIVVLSMMMLKLANQTTKYNDSMRIQDRKLLQK